MQNKTLFYAGISGAIAVAIGALGAHALKEALTPNQLMGFKTGNTYHIYHTIIILVIALFTDRNDKLIKTCVTLFFSGIILFSGSIYLLSTKDILGIENWKWLGPITPLGGILFISGWVTLAIYGAKRTNF
jgi:uncharacterized membrane protein YgdD (TMEM256/DUF423 family)